MTELNVIFFATAAQVAIFEHELKGQISDGAWENFRGSDYQIWCRANCLVAEVDAGERVGRRFRVNYDRFNFNRKDLVEIVGDRMLAYARLARAGYDPETICKLKSVILDWNGGVLDAPVDYKGAYYDELRTWYVGQDHDAIKAVVKDPDTYTMRDLRADLRAIMQTIRTEV